MRTLKSQKTTLEAIALVSRGEPNTRIDLPCETSQLYSTVQVPHGAVLNCAYNPRQLETHNDITKLGSAWSIRIGAGSPVLSPVRGVVVDTRLDNDVPCDHYLEPHNTNLVQLVYSSPKGPHLMRLEHITPFVSVGDRIEKGQLLGPSNAACGEAHVHLYFRDLSGNPAPILFSEVPKRENPLWGPVEDAIRGLKGRTLNQKRRYGIPYQVEAFDQWRSELVARLF